MAYSTPSQVKAIVETDITDAELLELIAETDAAIDILLSASVGAIIQRLVSRTWTAYRAMLKDPNSERLGEQQYDRATQLKLLKDEIDFYIKTGGGGIGFRYSYEQLPTSYISV